jgi:hypothetical protein
MLRFGAMVAAADRWSADHHIPRPDWTDLGAVRTYAALVPAAEAADTLTAATDPLYRVEQLIADTAPWADAARSVRALLDAVRLRGRQSMPNREPCTPRRYRWDR